MTQGRLFEVGKDIDIVPANAIFLEVLRYSTGKESTLGLLHDVTNRRRFLCYTLEDEYRKHKIAGETRIPAGTYDIKIRDEGGFHERYGKQFGSIHRGMLHIVDVPNFEYILIHCGNTDDDTAGCLLVGDICTQNITREGFIGNSIDAYVRIYPRLIHHLESGGKVKISFVDYDE